MIVAIVLVLALPLGVVADRIVAQGVRVTAILALLAFANSRHTVSVRLARPWTRRRPGRCSGGPLTPRASIRPQHERFRP